MENAVDAQSPSALLWRFKATLQVRYTGANVHLRRSEVPLLSQQLTFG